MLIDDGFVNDRLIRFLETELGMDELPRKLSKWKGKMSTSQLLLVMLGGGITIVKGFFFLSTFAAKYFRFSHFSYRRPSICCAS